MTRRASGGGGGALRPTVAKCGTGSVCALEKNGNRSTTFSKCNGHPPRHLRSAPAPSKWKTSPPLRDQLLDVADCGDLIAVPESREYTPISPACRRSTASRIARVECGEAGAPPGAAGRPRGRGGWPPSARSTAHAVSVRRNRSLPLTPSVASASVVRSVAEDGGVTDPNRRFPGGSPISAGDRTPSLPSGRKAKAAAPMAACSLLPLGGAQSRRDRAVDHPRNCSHSGLLLANCGSSRNGYLRRLDQHLTMIFSPVSARRRPAPSDGAHLEAAALGALDARARRCHAEGFAPSSSNNSHSALASSSAARFTRRHASSQSPYGVGDMNGEARRVKTLRHARVRGSAGRRRRRRLRRARQP